MYDPDREELTAQERAQLIAAALGWRAPAWAQAEIHLIDRELDACPPICVFDFEEDDSPGAGAEVE